MVVAIALPRFHDFGLSLTLFFFVGHFNFSADFLRFTKSEKDLSSRSLISFAKGTFELRYFNLFVYRVYLCDGFKCLLKGYVL